jgi:hypothetical protein
MYRFQIGMAKLVVFFLLLELFNYRLLPDYLEFLCSLLVYLPVF